MVSIFLISLFDFPQFRFYPNPTIETQRRTTTAKRIPSKYQNKTGESKNEAIFKTSSVVFVRLSLVRSSTSCLVRSVRSLAARLPFGAHHFLWIYKIRYGKLASRISDIIRLRRSCVCAPIFNPRLCVSALSPHEFGSRDALENLWSFACVCLCLQECVGVCVRNSVPQNPYPTEAHGHCVFVPLEVCNTASCATLGRLHIKEVAGKTRITLQFTLRHKSYWTNRLQE